VFFLYFIDTRRKLYLAAGLAVVLIVASVATGYMNLFSYAHLRRYTATFGLGTNPTTFPYVTLFGASLLWCLYQGAPLARWRGWLVPLLVGLPVMALASGSRTGVLQLLIFVALLFGDRSSGWSRTQRVRALLLLVCVALVVALLVPTLAFLRATSFGFTSIRFWASAWAISCGSTPPTTGCSGCRTTRTCGRWPRAESACSCSTSSCS
jgi:hypothetical protein